MLLTILLSLLNLVLHNLLQMDILKFTEKFGYGETILQKKLTLILLVIRNIKESRRKLTYIQKVFKVGVIATVTDVDTGISWRVKRSGGSNHADVQPLTAADTAKMKKAYGGSWSWNRRAIWVTIDGVTYAASMNGMPHGSGSITTNNFDGHHCIHFLNSRTHSGDRWDTAHQSAVQKAYKAGQ